jgi:hypothetical protein
MTEQEAGELTLSTNVSAISGDDFLNNFNNPRGKPCNVCSKAASIAYEYKSGMIKLLCPIHAMKETWEARQLELKVLQNKIVP